MIYVFAKKIIDIRLKSYNLLAKKMKDSLSSFLPNLPGVIDTPGSQDNSSLRGLIEKPPGR